MLLPIFLFGFLIILHPIKGDVNVQNLRVFEAIQNVSKTSVSSGCFKAIIESSLVTKLKMVDSSGFIPKGIFHMNMYDLGSYDECYNIEEITDKRKMFGKYCLGKFTVNKMETPIQIGQCLPNECSVKDFNQIFGLLTFHEDFCYTKAEVKDFDNADKIAFIVLGFFIGLTILSTMYDLFLYYLDKKPYHFTFLSFSLITNGQKILKTNPNQSQLSCINGVKVLSMLWVVYGHTHSSLVLSGISNISDIYKFIMVAKNTYLLSAPLSVDTFFAVGGLLTVYTALKSKKTSINVPMMYLHRYLRLTPALAIVILIQGTLIRYMGSGPFWGFEETYITPCKTYWWSSILYIQNFVNPETICCTHTWYLSVDMQLFILSPIVLIPLIKWPKYGLKLLILSIFLGFLVPFLCTYFYDINASLITMDIMKYTKYYYFPSHTRFGPYVIGMFFGWVLFKHKNDEKLFKISRKYKKILILFTWLIIFIGFLACTYGGTNVLRSKENGVWAVSFFNGLNKNAWAILVCLMIVLCTTGHGGPINAFLSLPMFQILSKLSYSIYLVHYLVINVRYVSTRVLLYFTETSMVYETCGNLVITIVLAFFLSAMFEAPVIVFEKCIFGDSTKTKINEEIKSVNEKNKDLE